MQDTDSEIEIKSLIICREEVKEGKQYRGRQKGKMSRVLVQLTGPSMRHIWCKAFALGQ